MGGDPLVAGTKLVIALGMTRWNETQLTPWHGHLDLRVRREVHFERAECGAPTMAAYERGLQHETNTIPRLQATWGRGQLAARSPVRSSRVLKAGAAAWNYNEVQVQAQAAKVLGYCCYREAFAALQFFAS